VSDDSGALIETRRVTWPPRDLRVFKTARRGALPTTEVPAAATDLAAIDLKRGPEWR
jgi:hypothetical protein